MHLAKKMTALFLTMLVVMVCTLTLSPNMFVAAASETVSGTEAQTSGETVFTAPGSKVIVDPANGAGCWTGGSALGDLQFSGVGTFNGNWPSRNAYQTGNKRGRVTFMYAGKKVQLPWFGTWTEISMKNNAAVTGVQVIRA